MPIRCVLRFATTFVNCMQVDSDEETSCNRVNCTEVAGLTHIRRMLFAIIVQRIAEESSILLQLEPGDYPFDA